ncbi:MAG: tRNA uridine-5-carboxymethylaminomethyl(34) synthesis GTPase MnmE [Eubacteriales bacterium]
MKVTDLNQTIAAVSTPPGKGGVALIRISGTDAFDIADTCFAPRSQKKLRDYPPRTAVYGGILYKGQQIDDGIAIAYRAPFSYTGEDMVELCCHGGVLLTQTVLESVLLAGAVPAEAGAFTRRAFINGKLSLRDAEAVGQLLEARSADQIKLATEQARGQVTAEVAALSESMLHLLSSVYAAIDYPEEDLAELSRAEIVAELGGIEARLHRLLDSYRTGHAISEGITTVIVGRPNVGKSTLYNLLGGDDAAIVTERAGTTRDLLERTLPLGRVVLHVYDTAGIWDTGDEVEKIGIERAREKMRAAELILAVFDGSQPFTAQDEALVSELQGMAAVKVALLNKADLRAPSTVPPYLQAFAAVLPLSAKYGDLSELTAAVDRLFTSESIKIGENPIIATARQAAALEKARTLLQASLSAFERGFSYDVAGSDLELALAALGELDGLTVSQQIVDTVFARFCVGK